MTTQPNKPEPSDEEKVIAKQLASWRKEIARLQDLIVTAEPSAQDEMDAFRSWYEFDAPDERGIEPFDMARPAFIAGAQWKATRQAELQSECERLSEGWRKANEDAAIKAQAAPSDLHAVAMTLLDDIIADLDMRARMAGDFEDDKAVLDLSN